MLRSVRTADDGQDAFVPRVSVTVAFVLTLASVIGLVLFLAHLATKIRVETMLRDVHTDASATLARVLPERGHGGGTALPDPPAETVSLPAARSGFLGEVDGEAVLAAAVEAGAVVVVDRQPGSSAVGGTPVGAAWPCSGVPFDDATRETLVDRVTSAITIGFERTGAQDVAFGLRQLTDVATKALSPGINDPTTAVHALSHSSALLCELVRRDLGHRVLRDDENRVRVVLHRPDIADLLELALAQPRRYGAADPDVLARLLTLLRELAWTTQLPAHHQVVTAQLERLRATIDAQDLDPTERAALARLAAQVELAVDGRWSSTG